MHAEPTHLPAPFFVFRTPLLPWDVLEGWSGTPSGGATESDYLARRLALREGLAALLQRPEIQESLFLASPDLVEAQVRWVKDPDSEKGARCERGLIRYLSRLCGRPTPFGLFAGCSRGRIGEATRLALGAREGYQRHTRLDMDYLCSLAAELQKDGVIAGHLRYRPNSSLYESGGRLRYAEGRMKDRDRSYHLVAVEPTPYLRETLRRAEGGATPEALAQALVGGDITLDEARGYLAELIESQLLVPELVPAVTGPEPLREMATQLSTLPEGAEAADALGRAGAALNALDGSGVGSSIETYQRIAEDLRALPAKVEMNRLFQTDLVKPAPEAELGPEVIAEIHRGLRLLHRLRSRTAGRMAALDRFRDAFNKRHEGEEIPLMEALDEDLGIWMEGAQASDTSPLLEGLAIPGTASEAGAPFTPFEAFLLKKMAEHPGAMALALEDQELEPYLERAPKPLPDSLAVMARLARPSGTFTQGDFRVALMGASGPSGANLLGRFCHGDEGLTEALRAYLREEEARHPEAVFAEVVHLPEGRVGNVILRPLLRGYEIPFLGRSGAPESQQIALTDLLVSVRGGRIVLRSKRLGREVRPRLSTAHNYTHRSLGVYRFLCMLQHQDVVGGLGWSWGALEQLPFLPRIELGRLVLATARWKAETKPLTKALEAEGFQRWQAFQAWRREQHLPQWIYLVDGDNRLAVDLDNPLMVDSFLDLVKGRPMFQMEEFYPDPASLCAFDGEGRYVHELVVPMTAASTPEVSKATDRIADMAAPSLQRTFLPGGEWLFAKLYGGAAALDQVLRERVRPLIAELKGEGAIDGWFFIRYGDPDWHLRIRFHGEPRQLWEKALPRLAGMAEELRALGLVRSMSLDTYQRELERYGSDAGMECSERIFQIDSEAVLELLSLYPGDAGADARWRFCLKGMDDLLEALGFDLEERHELLKRLRAGFLQEFGGPGPLERQLGDRFRKERARLSALVEGGAFPEEDPMAPGLRVWEARKAELKSFGKELRADSELGREALADVAGSYLHMHANRLLRGAHRSQELVLYDFLSRIYESRLARRRRVQAVE